MNIDVNSIQPTPSDFAEFVYCGVKWIHDKNKDLESTKKAKYLSYDYLIGNKYKDLKLGQQNEYKCIDWVLNKYNSTKEQILYNGTAEGSDYFLTSEIKYMKVNMQCKPDLIIFKDNKNLLFEFKAVRDLGYLLLNEFDSYHAQVWCYTFLKEIRIDDFFLMRYHIDPCENPFTVLKNLTPFELDTSKFIILFKQYTEAIISLKNKDYKVASILIDNIPKEEKEKKVKCSHCIYNKIGACFPWIGNAIL